MKRVKGLQHGLYEIYWASGGSSLAAIGYDQSGFNWMAPTNWIGMPTTDFGGWSSVKALKMLVPNDYSKKTKAIRSDFPKMDFTSENFDIISYDNT